MSSLLQITAKANGIVGSYNVTATAPNGVKATFALTNNSGTSTLQTTYGSPQAAAIGMGFGKPLEATLLDLNGNPIVGQTVCYTAPNSGASATLSGWSAVTGPTGTAEVDATANSTLGTYNVTATYGSLSTTFSLTNTLPPAALTISKSHSGTYHLGQGGVTYTITVSNGPAPAAGPTVGTVTVLEIVPPGLTLTAMSGGGWTCSVATTSCSRSDVLPPGGSYASITATLAAAQNASLSVTNQANVSGGGSAPANATDLTTLLPPLPSQCDVNTDGAVNIKDTQYEINEALGKLSPANILSSSGGGVAGGSGWSGVNVVDVQIVTNAVLGLGCSAN